MDYPQTEIHTIALDVSEIQHTRKGQKVINTFTSSSAEMFKTKRGHLALLVRLDIFEKLRRQLKLDLEDGLDGLKLVRLAEDTQKAVAS